MLANFPSFSTNYLHPLLIGRMRRMGGMGRMREMGGMGRMGGMRGMRENNS
jgi:hypothetical protein